MASRERKKTALDLLDEVRKIRILNSFPLGDMKTFEYTETMLDKAFEEGNRDWETVYLPTLLGARGAKRTLRNMKRTLALE